jgi:hypothetical protein
MHVQKKEEDSHHRRRLCLTNTTYNADSIYNADSTHDGNDDTGRSNCAIRLAIRRATRGALDRRDGCRIWP